VKESEISSLCKIIKKDKCQNVCELCVK